MSLAQAIIERDVARLPGRRDEAWRWTDLKGLLREMPPPPPPFGAALPPGPFVGLGEAEVVVVDGTVLGDPGLLIVPAGQRRAVRLRFVSAAGAAHVAQMSIRVGEGAELLLLESHEGPAERYVVDVALDVHVAAGGTLERVVIAADGPEAVRVATASVVLTGSARFAQTLLTDGARRQRLETRLAHPGAGADVRLDGAFVLTGQRHADATSIVTHEGPDGTTGQLTKGVVSDQARGVFQGRIVVAPGSDRTDARMGCHALVLSDRAEFDAKPELEIYADDVACAHGATVGALDEDVLFYVRQRGVPDAEARAMLTGAFVGEVVDRIGDEDVREAARAWAASRLER